MNELIGKTIDGFNFISIIGEGGMAFVYKAYDQKLDRFVAIKVIHPRISHSLISLQRFKKEARNQAKLLHPNIIAVLDLIKISSSVGIVMEYVEGESLSQLLKRCSRLDFAKTKEILRQALAGLNFAHSFGFVHRDIKPSNIIIRKDGVVKIADFGIAKSFSDSRPNSTASNIIGTAFYMSPEQTKAATRKAKSNYVFLKIILILLTILICFLVVKNVKITHFGKEEPTNKQLNPFSR